MATSWLELQNNLSSGASKLPVPKEDVGCGVSYSNASPESIFNLPDPAEAASVITDFLNNTQSAIDDIGDDIMGVLQDIGAFIPAGLFSGSISDSDEEETPQFADVTQYNNEVKEGGNIIVTTAHNDQTGDSFWQLKTSSGSGITFDTDGSCVISSSKNPHEDPKTGFFSVLSQGAASFDIGEALVIHVKNNNGILGDSKTAFSLIIEGNTDIEVRKGDLKIKGNDNISIEAAKSLELKGSDIKIHAGPGTGEKAKEGEPAKDEQSGVVEIKAGLFKNTSIAQQNVEGATFNKVTGEKAFIMDDPQATFSIQSAGSLELRCKGDMIEDIGGRKLTKVMTLGPEDLALLGGIPPVSIITNQSAGYYITNGNTITPSSTGSTETPPPLLEINSPITSGGHGFRVTAGAGNIILSTSTGNIALATEKSIIADITTTSKSATEPTLLKGLKPGFYIGSSANSLRLYSASEVAMGISSTPPPKFVDQYIGVTLAKAEVKHATGIYLN